MMFSFRHCYPFYVFTLFFIIGCRSGNYPAYTLLIYIRLFHKNFSYGTIGLAHNVHSVAELLLLYAVGIENAIFADFIGRSQGRNASDFALFRQFHRSLQRTGSMAERKRLADKELFAVAVEAEGNQGTVTYDAKEITLDKVEKFN